MYNPVQWLEIATKDLERAKTFYEKVFKLTFQYVEMPGSKMYMFGETEGIGSGGALVHSTDNIAGSHGTIVYFSFEDLAEGLNGVEPAGGKVLIPKTNIEDFGFFAHILDSEGNKIGLHSLQ